MQGKTTGKFFDTEFSRENKTKRFLDLLYFCPFLKLVKTIDFEGKPVFEKLYKLTFLDKVSTYSYIDLLRKVSFLYAVL